MLSPLSLNTSEKASNIFFSLHHSLTSPFPLLRMTFSFATSSLIKALLPPMPSLHASTQALQKHVKTNVFSTLQYPISSSHMTIFFLSLCAGAYFAQKHTTAHHTSAPLSVQLGRLLETMSSVAMVSLITLSLPEKIPFTARLLLAGTAVEAGTSISKTIYKITKYILHQALQAAQDLSHPVTLIGAAGILTFIHKQTEHDPLLNHTALLYSCTTLFSLFFLQMAKKQEEVKF
jgi:hypothetical protein